VSVREDALSYDLFQQFPAALEEADGAVRFGKGVVRFVGLWEDHDNCLIPRMVSKQDHGIKDLEEPVWVGLKSPFEEFVVDSTGAWCGLVGG